MRLLRLPVSFGFVSLGFVSLGFVWIALLGLLLGFATEARAADPCDKPSPRYRSAWVERTVTVPAVTRTVREAVFETIEVPVYGTRCTPTFTEVKVPVYRTRRTPVYRTCRTPRYEEVEEPVYAMRAVPLFREVCDRCTGERRQVRCGCRRERYQSGTRTVRRLVGYDEKQVICGTRCETYQAGHQIRRVRSGTQVERVQTGTRSVRRFKAWRCRTVVVCPERTRVVRECVRVRCDA